MGRLAVYCISRGIRKTEEGAGLEADDTGGFKPVSSNIFSNRKIRHKVWNLEEGPGWKYRLGKNRIC